MRGKEQWTNSPFLFQSVRVHQLKVTKTFQRCSPQGILAFPVGLFLKNPRDPQRKKKRSQNQGIWQTHSLMTLRLLTFQAARYLIMLFTPFHIILIFLIQKK